MKITNIILIMCWSALVFAICGPCFGESLPGRKIVIEHEMNGIIISSLDGLKDYYPGKENADKETVSVPEDQKLFLHLQDSTIDPENDHFIPGDLQSLCQQSRFAFQGVIIANGHSRGRIARALRILNSQKTLESLGFYQCELSTEILSPMAHSSSLRSMNLNRCPIEPGALSGFGNVFKSSSIEKISFDRTHLTNTFGQLAKIKGLREISISHTGIGRGDFKNMRNQTSVVRLDLEKVIVNDLGNDDSSLKNINKFVNLEDLFISSNAGYINNYFFLLGLKKIKKLSLCGTGLKQKDLYYIGMLSTLSELDLSDQQNLENADFDDLKNLKNLKMIRIDEVSLSDKAKAMFENMGVVVKYD